MVQGRLIAALVSARLQISFKKIQDRFNEIKSNLETDNYLTPRSLLADLQNFYDCLTDTDGTDVEIAQLQKKLTDLMSHISLISTKANQCMGEQVIAKKGLFTVVKESFNLIPKNKKKDMEIEMQELCSHKSVARKGRIEKIAVKEIIEIISRSLYARDFVRLSATSTQFRKLCGEVILPFPYIVFSPDFILKTEKHVNVTFNKLNQANANQSSLGLFSSTNAQTLKRIVEEGQTKQNKVIGLCPS